MYLRKVRHPVLIIDLVTLPDRGRGDIRLGPPQTYEEVTRRKSYLTCKRCLLTLIEICNLKFGKNSEQEKLSQSKAVKTLNSF